jgi:hypothetical protein
MASSALPDESPLPSGKIGIQTKSLAFGIGASWGEGTLSFANRDFRFSANGLTMLDFGIATARTVGDIYKRADLGLLKESISPVKLGLHWVAAD